MTKGIVRHIDIENQSITIETKDEVREEYFYLSSLFGEKSEIYFQNMFDRNELYFDIDGKIVKNISLYNNE